MKQIKKVLALLLAIVMLFAMTSCNSVGNWILKTENMELPVGAYIMYESTYYQYAIYYVPDYTKSPLDQEIKLEDDKKATGAEWIKTTSLDAVKSMLAVFEECNRLGIALTENEKKVIKDAVEDDWAAREQAYELLGIAKSTSQKMSEYSKLDQKLFAYYYGENGTEAVTKKDITEYFEENYASVDFFRVSIMKDSTNKLSEDEIETIRKELDQLADRVNNGSRTMEKIVEDYNKQHSSAKVSLTSNIVVLENTYAEDLVKKMEECDEEEAIVFEEGNYLYLFSRNKIEDETEEYLKENEDALRHEMKDEAYYEYIDKTIEALDITINEAAVNKYSPKWIERKIN